MRRSSTSVAIGHGRQKQLARQWCTPSSTRRRHPLGDVAEVDDRIGGDEIELADAAGGPVAGGVGRVAAAEEVVSSGGSWSGRAFVVGGEVVDFELGAVVHKEPPSSNNNLSNHSGVDYGRLSQRTTAAAAAAKAVTRHPSAREQPVDVRINDIVGNGVSGILYKWVNYGKGWRPRWFVLQDGVLSYYKIHGPDRIVVTPETEKGSKVIGETSIRRLSRHRNPSPQKLRRKPFGEVHLKVSHSL